MDIQSLVVIYKNLIKFDKFLMISLIEKQKNTFRLFPNDLNII